MLPASYHLPFAAVLVLAGAVCCFYGHRLFRIVLVLFGFIIGAMAASSIFGVSDRAPMLVAALVGGILGALLLRGAYFVGVALVGAILGVTAARLLLGVAHQPEPGVWVVVLTAVAGAAAAVYLQRYFIILGTAFVGAWTLLVGALEFMGDRFNASEFVSADAWVFYPLDPAPGRTWVPIVWLIVGLVGTAVQLGFTGGDKGRIGGAKKK